MNLTQNIGRVGGALCMAAACAFSLAFAFPARAQLEPFDMEDYFLLDQDSQWHYRGDGQPGSSSEDNFTWTVLETPMAVAGGVEATRILTLTDEGTDDREKDEDFWAYDAEGNLFFYGFHNGVADGGGAFPVQDVILDDPLLVGGRGMRIGDVTTDTARASVAAVIPFVGGKTVTATILSRITYVGFIPIFDTGLGPLTDVLLVTVEVTGEAVYSPGFPFPDLKIDIPVRESKFYLKAGWGMVGHDQQADLNDAERQVVDQARVAGVDLEAPPFVEFHITLGDSVEPAVRRAAGGSATVIVDTVADTYSYEIAVTGLSSAETGAAVHGFVSDNASAAPVLHTLPLGSPKTGTWTYEESQEYGILSGQTYINIQTENNPSGEVGGQVEQGAVLQSKAAVQNWHDYR